MHITAYACIVAIDNLNVPLNRLNYFYAQEKADNNSFYNEKIGIIISPSVGGSNLPELVLIHQGD